VVVLAAAVIGAGVYLLRSSSPSSAATHHRRAFTPPGMCDLQPKNVGNITVWDGFTECTMTVSGPVPASLRKAGYAAAMQVQERQWRRKGYTHIQCKVKPSGYVCRAGLRSDD
jgi:hypothetical protein